MRSKINTPLAGQSIITRGLPKSGQTISYQDYDDGYYHYGWWKNRAYADNKIRFIAQTIGGHDVVTDRATGLMWAADGDGWGCYNGTQRNWSVAIIHARDLAFAGFTNWRLPAVNELASIIDCSQNNPAIDAFLFPNTYGADYWTSTTAASFLFFAWIINFTNGDSASQHAKTDLNYLRCVRSVR